MMRHVEASVNAEFYIQALLPYLRVHERYRWGQLNRFANSAVYVAFYEERAMIESLQFSLGHLDADPANLERTVPWGEDSDRARLWALGQRLTNWHMYGARFINIAKRRAARVRQVQRRRLEESISGVYVDEDPVLNDLAMRFTYLDSMKARRLWSNRSRSLVPCTSILSYDFNALNHRILPLYDDHNCLNLTVFSLRRPEKSEAKLEKDRQFSEPPDSGRRLHASVIGANACHIFRRLGEYLNQKNFYHDDIFVPFVLEALLDDPHWGAELVRVGYPMQILFWAWRICSDAHWFENVDLLPTPTHYHGLPDPGLLLSAKPLVFNRGRSSLNFRLRGGILQKAARRTPTSTTKRRPWEFHPWNLDTIRHYICPQDERQLHLHRRRYVEAHSYFCCSLLFDIQCRLHTLSARAQSSATGTLEFDVSCFWDPPACEPQCQFAARHCVPHETIRIMRDPRRVAY